MSVEYDIYNGALPLDVVPEEVQAIVYDEDVYREYLLERRRKDVASGDHENPIVKNLARTARVREEDLIW